MVPARCGTIRLPVIVDGSWQMRWLETVPTFEKPAGQSAAGGPGGVGGGVGVVGVVGVGVVGAGTKAPTPGEATPSEPLQAPRIATAAQPSSAERKELIFCMRVSVVIPVRVHRRRHPPRSLDDDTRLPAR